MIREEVRSQLQLHMKNLHKKSVEINDMSATRNNILFSEIRSSNDLNDDSNRLVVFLHGTGCSRVEDVGGCTFCGFYKATNYGKKISDSEYIKQIESVLSNQSSKMKTCKTICIYNDGSLLCEREISFSVLLKILSMIQSLDQFQKVVIESKVEDITVKKLEQIRDVVKKPFEIAVGFESAHPLIRDICVNKSFDTQFFEHTIALSRNYNISIIPLIMLKPPFLTEAESIQDALMSLIYLESFHLKRIDFELPTVENHTLMKELWDDNLYQPLMLWSLVEILEYRNKLKLKTPLYISPMSYSVNAIAKAKNCEKCTPLLLNELELFNRSNSLDRISKITCHCKQEWRELVNTPVYSSILHRCYTYLKKKGEEHN